MSKSFACSDEKIAAYVDKIYGREDDVLSDIRRRAALAGLPDIHVGAIDGNHLEVLVRATGARKIVEIGTLAGYSAVRIARALPPDGHLYTFEYEPKHAEIAGESFRKAGVAGKVTLFVGPAVENLDEIAARAPFDLVFIDADKVNYGNYLEWAARSLKSGGTLIADNTFGFGRIAEKNLAAGDAQTDMVRALQAFNEKLAADPRFNSTILPTGEGLSLAVKR